MADADAGVPAVDPDTMVPTSMDPATMDPDTMVPTSMDPAQDGMMPEGGATAPEEMAELRPCITEGSQIQFIGDSYSTYALAHGPMATFMTERAREAGALPARESYRDRAVAGTTIAAGAAQIPQQWQAAKRDLPVHVVVMSASGNDVIIFRQDCNQPGAEDRAECQEVVMTSLNAGQKMWDDMKASGVTDVIWFWYPHTPGGSGNGISDYTYDRLVDMAASASTASFHVHMVPTVDIFEGHPEYFALDNLHAYMIVDRRS